MKRPWCLVNRHSNTVVLRANSLLTIRRQLPVWRLWFDRLRVPHDLVVEMESPVETARRSGAV